MRPSDPEHDPVVRELREHITQLDLAILAAVNDRIELVHRLREHKLAQGWDFVDKAREDRLLATLAAENPGPLSESGVRDLFAELLALTKRELDG
jgi:3-deoxy-7-phosphoheptulonate synthase/chorismate mutase